jgi:pimeloyl-ACP methyl ester carboxylesterase
MRLKTKHAAEVEDITADPQGKPLFYLHGTPGSRLESSRFHDMALAKHYRVIGIDRPGMGLSSIDKSQTILSLPGMPKWLCGTYFFR